jgi:hypothetical protein
MKKNIILVTSLLVLVTVMGVVLFIGRETKYEVALKLFKALDISVENINDDEVIMVYDDINNKTFADPLTASLLQQKAEEMEITEATVNLNVAEIYEFILGGKYTNLISTKHITSSQISAINKGLSYKEIIEILGNTKDIGSGLHVLQYAVDDNKILYLSFADENDICDKSGSDLLMMLEDADEYIGSEVNTFNATVINKTNNSILVSCPTNESFDIIYLNVNESTVISFADGSEATFDDVENKITVTISDQILESYPPQGTALKIVIR